MPTFRTQFNGYAVQFSPFNPNRVAVATSQNFGIIGNGRQYVLELGPGGVREVASFDTADGLYDCCWSESHEHLLVSASGDGSVKVWDCSGASGSHGPHPRPLRSLEEHRHEVYAVSWNLVTRDCFLSASWDDTVKLWNLETPQSVRTFAEHGYCVYAASWNPVAADVFASASGDCSVKLWDVRQPFSSLTIPAHAYEVLCCDWSKYNDAVLATGSVDKSVRLWDVRNPSQPLQVIPAHAYAVRRVKWSPWHANTLYSCSYDMSCAAWDTGAPQGAQLARRWEAHSEFCVGLDASSLVDGLIATAGWDELVHVWHQSGDPRDG